MVESPGYKPNPKERWFSVSIASPASTGNSQIPKASAVYVRAENAPGALLAVQQYTGFNSHLQRGAFPSVCKLTVEEKQRLERVINDDPAITFKHACEKGYVGKYRHNE